MIKMGCILTVEEKKSKEIDVELRRDGRIAKKEVKLLLLGSGESGKSTIFKQMKIIQDEGAGFSLEERQEYRSLIQGNCISQMKVLVTSAIDHNMSPAAGENEVRFERFAKILPTSSSWSSDVAADIHALWKDETIQKIFKLRDRQFQLNDNATYVFNNVMRFSDANYVPSIDDVLRTRVRTTGIQEAKFKFSTIDFRMFDVGGQRSERRKWIHCFDDVTAVIFCVALSEYDMKLREEETENRMKDSLVLFKETVNNCYLEKSSFILFFNKVDLFREKIQEIDLAESFPAYQGGLGNFDEASTFVKNMFLDQLGHSQKQIFSHFTCAIDTKNIQYVFKAVRETLLNNVITTVIQL